MAPRKPHTALGTKNAAATIPSNPISHLEFPQISPKRRLITDVFVEDQILLIHDFLTLGECKEFVKFIDSQPLELTPPKKKGEADRVNLNSVAMAHRLFDLLSPHLPLFPYPASVKRPDGASARCVHSFNPNIRMYKYTPGQHFGPHYDDSVRDPQTGAKSEWTLLVYLTGAEDGVKGGETIFYRNQRSKTREVITPPLIRGTALLHRSVAFFIGPNSITLQAKAVTAMDTNVCFTKARQTLYSSEAIIHRLLHIGNRIPIMLD
ncbi:uncharacterized protein FIBRA_01353 [Fibroporia radiculosa]|uniref:Prolyl 4-hydroxylase alpha subunit domain-containing protein n=1 Tax=Fibroporia radiculosa TaxID=599839 RepID=J4GJY0_9APHY|nr:uncharacterized protein FIBRA_01353 [Fibroporia radiculosa]CCL99335.1 predicted protein [Fibroporia radiculosa]